MIFVSYASSTLSPDQPVVFFFPLNVSVQHHHPHHYGHSEEYYTESSRGSDLSDIMEEDEEDLYSEMQLEEGRRRSINSHNTLKVHTDTRQESKAGITVGE